MVARCLLCCILLAGCATGPAPRRVSRDFCDRVDVICYDVQTYARIRANGELPR